MSVCSNTYFAYADAAAQAQGLAQAVSGGCSPVRFLEALGRIKLAWEKVVVMLVDERWVPAQDSASNGDLVRHHLLQHQADAAQWQPLVAAAVNADFFRQPEHIHHSVQAARQQYPQPDVVVLGMGNDGHTASLFAQAPQLVAALVDDAAALLPKTSPTAPHQRISMSLPAIAVASGGWRYRQTHCFAAGAKRCGVAGEVGVASPAHLHTDLLP